jgi:tryptophan-rich sensory protein
MHSVFKQAIGLVGWVSVCFLAAAIGARASIRADVFYQQLRLPEWAPPAWLFGPVWTLLYLLMGVAAWLVWREHEFRNAAAALGLFFVQLAANALWSWIFCAWREGGWALADICLLLALIICTIFAFWRLNAMAATLLLPYLGWTAFATALNYSIWRLNPQSLG